MVVFSPSTFEFRMQLASCDLRWEFVYENDLAATKYAARTPPICVASVNGSTGSVAAWGTAHGLTQPIDLLPMYH